MVLDETLTTDLLSITRYKFDERDGSAICHGTVKQLREAQGQLK